MYDSMEHAMFYFCKEFLFFWEIIYTLELFWLQFSKCKVIPKYLCSGFRTF